MNRVLGVYYRPPECSLSPEQYHPEIPVSWLKVETGLPPGMKLMVGGRRLGLPVKVTDKVIQTGKETSQTVETTVRLPVVTMVRLPVELMTRLVMAGRSLAVLGDS